MKGMNMNNKMVVNELLKIAKDIVAKNPLKEALDLAFDIVDGIDGAMSETGEFPDNFWKEDVLDRY